MGRNRKRECLRRVRGVEKRTKLKSDFSEGKKKGGYPVHSNWGFCMCE